jgi:drug/metabolite transporter (DMT)-like permease
MRHLLWIDNVSDQAGPDQTAATHPPAALAGIGMMMLGIFLFVVNDVLGKWLVATYSVGEVLLIRSLAAVILLVPMVWPMVRREGFAPFMQVNRPLVQLARIVCSTLEVACFYWAVTDLPLANVICFYLAGPIFVTALSVPMLVRITSPPMMGGDIPSKTCYLRNWSCIQTIPDIRELPCKMMSCL